LGAWGTGIFDNDTTADFGHTIADGGGLRAMETALDAVLASGNAYLESSAGEEVLAAADAVARMKGSGSGSTGYTEALDAWIQKDCPAVSDALMAKAPERRSARHERTLQEYDMLGQMPSFRSMATVARGITYESMMGRATTPRRSLERR